MRQISGYSIHQLRAVQRDTLIDCTKDIEEAEGWDSVETIDRMYRWPDEESSCRCVMPGCDFRRHDPVEMWWHVHHTGHRSIFT